MIIIYYIYIHSFLIVHIVQWIHFTISNNWCEYKWLNIYWIPQSIPLTWQDAYIRVLNWTKCSPTFRDQEQTQVWIMNDFKDCKVGLTFGPKKTPLINQSVNKFFISFLRYRTADNLSLFFDVLEKHVGSNVELITRVVSKGVKKTFMGTRKYYWRVHKYINV